MATESNPFAGLIQQITPADTAPEAKTATGSAANGAIGAMASTLSSGTNINALSAAPRRLYGPTKHHSSGLPAGSFVVSEFLQAVKEMGLQ